MATHDVLLEGRHFRLDWSSPSDVGWKAVAVSVSDLAAMGAEPRWLLLGLGAPPSTAEEVLRGIYEGIGQGCAEYGCALVGGDTVATESLVLAMTALGEVDGDPLTRSGARPGDVLAVTGPLGLAATGTTLLLAGLPRTGLIPDDVEACLRAHRRPRARVAEGRALRTAGATAGIDLSDGLFADVRRIAEQSGVGVEIDARAIPVAPAVARIAARRGWKDERLAAAGGEDFELLVAVSRVDDSPVPLLPVGRVVAEGMWIVRDGRREELPGGGWDHFRAP